MLDIGDKVFNFNLPDCDGNFHSLDSFLGKKVVLYLYPKDNTPGCSKQACDFRDKHEIFEKNNVVIIGISKDGQKSHSNFIEKYKLPFILLSDVDNEVAKHLGVFGEKKIYGKTFHGVFRSTFIIDEGGILIKHFKNVKASQNIDLVMQFLDL